MFKKFNLVRHIFNSRIRYEHLIVAKMFYEEGTLMFITEVAV